MIHALDIRKRRPNLRRSIARYARVQHIDELLRYRPRWSSRIHPSGRSEKARIHVASWLVNVSCHPSSARQGMAGQYTVRICAFLSLNRLVLVVYQVEYPVPVPPPLVIEMQLV